MLIKIMLTIMLSLKTMLIKYNPIRSLIIISKLIKTLQIFQVGRKLRCWFNLAPQVQAIHTFFFTDLICPTTNLLLQQLTQAWKEIEGVINKIIVSISARSMKNKPEHWHTSEKFSCYPALSKFTAMSYNSFEIYFPTKLLFFKPWLYQSQYQHTEHWNYFPASATSTQKLFLWLIS